MLRESKSNQRLLRYESLEDRRMLALFVVDSVADSLAPGTLRSAIADSDANTLTKDEIIFDASLFNSGTPVINLSAPIQVDVPVKIHSEFGAVVIQNGGSVQEALFLRPNLGQGISEDFEISDLVFEDFEYGIHVDHTGGTPNSTIEGVKIVGNAFFDNERGIFLERPSYPFEIRDNQIFGIQAASTNPEAGIWIDDTGAVTNTYGPLIDNNIIVDNEDWGIFLLGSEIEDLAITNNRIGADALGFAGPNGVGILTQGVDLDGATIAENEIVANGDGINLLHADGVEISDNLIAFNVDNGIELSNEANDHLVTGNDFIENGNAGIAVGAGLSDDSIRNRISQNYFENNGGLPIDLGRNGVVEPNDSGDTDDGPNDVLNRPVLRQELVSLNAGQWSVPLDVDFQFGGDYEFEFYRYEHSMGAWTFVATEQFEDVSSGASQLTATFDESVFDDDDIVAAISIGNSGGNSGNTSEFSEPMYLSALAPTFLVSTEEDESAADYSFFDLSLREALELAGDTAYPDVDTITFAPWVDEIVLDTGPLVVDSEVAIVGTGAGLVSIDADGEDQVFTVSSDATLRRLMLTGAIEAAVYTSTSSGVDLVVEQTEIAGNGSGIDFTSGGSLTVSASTIAESDDGRGIFVAADSALLTNTTISNNETEDKGAGIYVGYRPSAEEVVLVNVTITENHAYTSTAAGSLPDDVAGGIYIESDMDVLMYNTIAAYNFAGSSAGINSDLGVEEAGTSSGHIEGLGNLIGVVGNSNYYGTAIIIGTDDPLLDALAYNGGPTRTHMPEADSDALDSGNNAIASSYGLDEDQRGSARPINLPGIGGFFSTVDIGAVELALEEL